MGRKKFLIAGLVLVLAMGFIAYRGFASSATYYMTISELKAKGDYAPQERLRVKGQVDPLSVKTTMDTQGQTLKFTIVDGELSLPVFYRGVVPDTFRPDNEVMVEGKYDPQGIFQADSILTQCPSRYTPGT